MRAREFIFENNSEFPASQTDAAPGMRGYPNLDNSSPYLPWRFAAHFIPGADGKNPYEHEPIKDGPSGQKLVTVSYTKEDDAMINQAEKAFGHEAHHIRLSPEGSSEHNDVHKVSPMTPKGPVKRKS